MKPADLEALVIKQGEYLQAAEKAIQALTDRLNTESVNAAFQVERNKYLTARLEELAEKLSELRDHQDGQNDVLADLSGRPDLTARVEELATEFTTELHDMDSRVKRIETLVLARNASAATKRNMTDEDALRVLTGDLRELSHKDAAEKIALTYAQVYSCRLEFTFKHVHKDLRDNVQGWKNPWSK